MTAAPQNGEEEDLQLFMALLDGDRFEGRFGDRFYVTIVSDWMRRLWMSLGMGYEHGNHHPTFVKVPTCPSFLGIPNRRRAMTDSTPCGGTGHCLCRAVQYHYEGDPITIGLCQCDRCQRQSGSAFFISVIFPRHAETITGPLPTYEARIHGNSRLCRHFSPTRVSAPYLTPHPHPRSCSLIVRALA